MFDIDKWQEILGTMRKNKLRTFLTAFGVFWGIFMLVMLLGAGKGMQNGVEGEFGEEAKSAFWIWSGRTSVPSHGLKPGREIQFSNEDLIALAREIDEVEVTAPRNNLWGEYVIKYQDKNAAFRVFGTTKGFLQINGEKLNSGRLLNEIDFIERRKVVILGERAAKVLFKEDEDPIGKYIDIRGVYFRVVGIFNLSENGGRNEERAFIPFSTLQYTFGQQNRVHLMGLITKPGANPQEVQAKIRKILARQHKFDTKDEQAVGVNSNEENYARFMGLFAAIRTFVWVVGIGTLIAGIVGVSNIMLIIVKERTREIGVRKAMGATPFSIVSLIIQESIFITALSGYMGLLAGAGLLDLMAWGIRMIEEGGGKLPFFSRPEIDLGVAVSATVVLVIAGALAGLVPALKAANVKPIEALRAD
ncbi:MAG: ABC transporter permease [Microscillaceae bacterium]|jgi:putative ABC transport system permease protein|nr:ABC transporter permease [Microscillaceae bacterium]